MLNSAAPENARGWLWPVVTLAGLAAIAVALLTRPTAPDVTFSIFATRFLGIFIEAAPFLLLGTLVSGLLEVFVSREDIVRWIPRNAFAAPLLGAFLGFAFPVCECGVVPVTRRLFTKGLPMSAGVAFLLAAPVMNPIVLVSTYIAFGFGPVLIARYAVTAVVAISVGVVFALAANPEQTLLPASFAAKAPGGLPVVNAGVPADNKRPGLGAGLVRALQFGTDEFFDMGRYLVIGCLLAATMQMFAGQGDIQREMARLGSGPLISVITLQIIAFVLSVCSTVDAFIALAFTGTFTTGSVVAFLTFGPMIDIKSTLMFAGVFRPRTVVYLVLLPFLMTLLTGVWINLLSR